MIHYVLAKININQQFNLTRLEIISQSYVKIIFFTLLYLLFFTILFSLLLLNVDTLGAVISPFIGILIDKYGKRASLIVVS